MESLETRIDKVIKSKWLDSPDMMDHKMHSNFWFRNLWEINAQIG
jgi:hypothetical protein